MGNIVLVNQAMQAEAIPLTKKFNLENLIQKEIVKAVFRSGGGADEHRPLKEIFEDFENQENENFQENWKRNLIKELNELHTAGLSTADYFTQDLKETRFEKYFRVVDMGAEEGHEYARLQYMKFFIMYSYIKPFYTEESGSKDNFYKNLADQLESTDDGGMSVYSFEMGLSLTFTLLDELSQASPAILEKAMKNIYAAIVNLKTGLFKTDDYKFYAREEILNRHREYLLKLFKSDRSNQGVKDLAVKLIIIIGNLRTSGEDYLIAYNLIKENNMKINLDSELFLNKFFQENPSSTHSHSQPKFKLSEKNSREIEILTGMDTDPNRSSHTAFAFDKEYMYLVNKDLGVFKVGLNKTLLTTPGFVYNANSSNRSYEKRQAIYVDGNLYIRGEHTDTNQPFQQIDKNTLEVSESEELKALNIKNKRNTDSDTWNKKVLEFLNYQQFQEQKEKGELEEYRTLGYTPLFTDGQYIYVVATYIKVKDDSEDYSGFEIEAYCPKTWK